MSIIETEDKPKQQEAAEKREETKTNKLMKGGYIV